MLHILMIHLYVCRLISRNWLGELWEDVTGQKCVIHPCFIPVYLGKMLNIGHFISPQTSLIGHLLFSFVVIILKRCLKLPFLSKINVMPWMSIWDVLSTSQERDITAHIFKMNGNSLNPSLKPFTKV